MKLSYCLSSSVQICSQNNKVVGVKSCNLSTICHPISLSLGFNINNGRSKNVSTKLFKLSSIQARAQSNGSSHVISGKAGKFGGVLGLIRLYTLRGLLVASSSLFLRVVIENPNLIDWSLVLKALTGFFPIACANIYTTTINQIFDVEIDKINKPFLPLAAGDISVKSAWLLAVFVSTAGLLVVGFTCPPLVTCLYICTIACSTMYSVPPIRVKKSVIGPPLWMSLGMGIVLNFSVYYSMRTTLGLPFGWSAPLVFITTFASVISGVMGIIKDLSDVEGDSKFEIPTLATKIGVRNVAYVGCGFLLLNYVGAILAAVYMPQVLKRTIMIPVHSILALILIYKMRLLEQANYTKEASESFYMFIWNLYYAEYIILPFI